MKDISTEIKPLKSVVEGVFGPRTLTTDEEDWRKFITYGHERI